MARVAFCGLGQMGAPMAARLVAAGHDVVVWNRSPDKAKPLVDLGATLAETPAAAARDAEAAITMLADPAALEEVVFGPDGLAEGLPEGAMLIEMSTVGPDALREVAQRLRPRLRVIDAPVLGSVAQAEDGELKVFVGASPEEFARWVKVLGALGTPFHLGPLGSGASMKLVANSTLGALMTALGEALALADRLGLDQKDVFDVLVGSPIGITARSKRNNVASGRYPPNFKLRLAVKDMDLVHDTASRLGLELRVAEAARSWFKDAAAKDLGEMDYSAVVAVITGGPAELPAPDQPD
ncbi:MAG TPA: NAD(P)-dependent oxidoreductase [Actinomycetota bacterium]|nr:NAD(P)-dependent oxidoreductase [Actinomycetota bacterium]